MAVKTAADKLENARQLGTNCTENTQISFGGSVTEAIACRLQSIHDCFLMRVQEPQEPFADQRPGRRNTKLG